mgnify:CR=1 FL=1
METVLATPGSNSVMVILRLWDLPYEIALVRACGAGLAPEFHGSSSVRGGDTPTVFGSLQDAIDVARKAAPGMDIAFVGFPGSRFSTPHHYMVFMRGDTPLTARLLKPVMIDAETGDITATRSLLGI